MDKFTWQILLNSTFRPRRYSSAVRLEDTVREYYSIQLYRDIECGSVVDYSKMVLVRPWSSMKGQPGQTNTCQL